MSDQKPTGVFVRLPLSDEQRELMVDAATLGQPDDSHDKAIIAIGTPVTGGELEVVCSIAEDILRDISELDDDDEEYVTDMVFKPNPEGVDTAPLVRQSDALAKLAEKDAEIARLRKALEQIRDLRATDKPNHATSARRETLWWSITKRIRIAEEALKGPKA